MVADLLATVGAAQPFLADWPIPRATRPIRPTSLPVLRSLSGTAELCTPATAALVGALVGSASELAWRQSYAVDDFGSDFLAGYGWTELVGSTGPIASDRIACGFLVLGPEIHYPAHAHEAEELYLPLAGTAFWQRGDAEPTLVAPGTPIHHPGWLPHAMQTSTEPLVALYLWRGGVLGARPQILGRS